jgi:hypothetical protein
MPFDPWNVPHDCEKAEVAERLVHLSAKQRKVVRSYVRNVEFGEMSLTQWIDQDQYPRVSLSTWRRPESKGGNYWGTEDSPNLLFRDAVQVYVTAYARWETEEEETSIRSAGREMRLGALNAARRITDLVDNADKDETKLNAAKTVLDRASMETAEKSSVSVGITSEDFTTLRNQAADEAEEIEEKALQEWQA